MEPRYENFLKKNSPQIEFEFFYSKLPYETRTILGIDLLITLNCFFLWHEIKFRKKNYIEKP